MAVPETAMNKNHFAARGEHEIRATGQVSSMQPEAKAETVNKAAYDNFRLSIAAANT